MLTQHWDVAPEGAFVRATGSEDETLARLPLTLVWLMAHAPAMTRCLLDTRQLKAGKKLTEKEITDSKAFVEASSHKLLGMAFLGTKKQLPALKLLAGTYEDLWPIFVSDNEAEAVSWLLTRIPKKKKGNQAGMSAEEVFAVRKSLGMTQQEFAAALGVTQSAVSFWERGERTVDARTAKLIHFIQEATPASKARF